MRCGAGMAGGKSAGAGTVVTIPLRAHWTDARRPHDRRGRHRGVDHPPGQGVLQRTRARRSSTSSTTTRPSRSRSWRRSADRPVLLERYPDGAGGKSFFQKRVPKSAPDVAHHHRRVHAERHHERRARRRRPRPPAVGGEPGLPRLPRVAEPRCHDPRCADELRIDLDPSPGVGFDAAPGGAPCSPTTCSTSSASRRTSRRPARVGCTSTCALRAAVGQLRGAGRRGGARPRARAPPPGPDHRRSGGRRSAAARVFVDFNQNAPHKTVFGAWCARPRVGAQVSTPITWDELDDGRARRAHHRHRARRAWPSAGDPWAGMYDRPAGPRRRCSSGPAHDLADGLMDAPWPPVYPKSRTSRRGSRRAAPAQLDPRVKIALCWSD